MAAQLRIPRSRSRTEDLESSFLRPPTFLSLSPLCVHLGLAWWKINPMPQWARQIGRQRCDRDKSTVCHTVHLPFILTCLILLVFTYVLRVSTNPGVGEKKSSFTLAISKYTSIGLNIVYTFVLFTTNCRLHSLHRNAWQVGCDG